jgi:hypothetical protein
MIRTRSARTLATLLVTVSMALAALAGPVTVLAATPSWEDLGIVALPTEVTPGATAAYALKIKNKGPSNISQLFLITADGSPTPTFASPSQGSCTLASPMVCTLGSLRKNGVATVVIAFNTPDDGSTEFSVDFEWNTTGLGSGDNDQSHGDAIDKTGTTALNPDATNFAGRFLLAPGFVENSQSLTSTNPQTVRLDIPQANIPATVEDGPGVTPGPCPTGETCAGWAELHVNQGLPFNFTAFMQLDSSLGLPNANNIEFGHISDLNQSSEINRCQFRRNNPTPTNIPCFTATNIGGGDVAATFYLDENGKIFGH